MQASIKSNAIAVYIRMGISLAIGLYTTKAIFTALGVTDYGIYNIIASTIGMIGFINIAMAVSTQRCLSLEIGNNNPNRINSILSASIFLHLAIAIIIGISFQLANRYIIDNVLIIPASRILAAKTALAITSITTAITIATVPFDALMTASESFRKLSAIEVTESAFKLAIAIGITFCSSDRLIVYASLVLFSTAIIASIKVITAIKTTTFEIKISITKAINPENYIILKFGFWNFFGAMCNMAKVEGLALLLNRFGGTGANAAFGIANQVTSQVIQFANALQRVVNPRIFRNFGTGDISKANELAQTLCRYSLLVTGIVAVPLGISAPLILRLWLKTPPPTSALFIQISLLSILISQISSGLQTRIQSTNKVAIYQMAIGGTVLLTIPVGYIILAMGATAPNAIYAVCITEVAILTIRILYLKYAGNFTAYKFALSTGVPSIGITGIAFGLFFIAKRIPISEPVQIGIITCIGLISWCTAFLVLFPEERIRILQTIKHQIDMTQSRSTNTPR